MSRARDLSKIGNINTFAVDSTDTQVGIASTVPNATLDVGGDGVFTGIVTASSFSGSLNDTNIVGTACTFTTGTFNGNVTIGGTLTYEDVTNVDALGIVTARAGVNVSGGQLQVGAGFSVGPAGVVTATSFSGGGLVSVGNQADNRLVTVTGTTDQLNGEGDLTFDGSTLTLTGNQTISSNLTIGSGITMGSAGVATFSGTSDVHLLDNVQLNVGDGSDLKLYHDGTNSAIQNATGNLYVYGGTNNVYIRPVNGEDSIIAKPNSGVDIYYDNSKKFETTQTGTIVTGVATVSSHVADVATFTSNQSASTIYVKDTDGDGIFISGSSAYGHRIYTNTTEDLLLGTNSAENFRIKSGGNVGINTNNPNHELTVFGDEVNFRLTHDGSTNKYNALYLHVNGTGAEFNSYQDGTGTKRPIIVKQYDTERLRVDATGRVLVGLMTAREAVGAIGDPHIQLEGLGADTGSMSIIRHAASSAGSYLVLGKTRGTTDLSNTIVQDDDTIGSIIFAPADGNDINQVCASITAMINGTPGSNDVPGALTFRTTSDGGTSPTERLKITRTGGFSFNNGEFVERCNITAGKLSDNTNIDLADGMVHYFTTQESTTSTPNIRVNSSTSLNDVMTDGDVCTVTLVTTAAAGGYSAHVTIDGNAVTEEWVGGSAPDAGGDDGLDIYVYTIICIHASNTGDSGFKVIGNKVNAT